MAISSFEHNVIIRDKDKIDEIKNALCYENSAFANVKPSEKDALPPKCKRNMVSIKINIKTLQEVAEFFNTSGVPSGRLPQRRKAAFRNDIKCVARKTTRVPRYTRNDIKCVY